MADILPDISESEIMTTLRALILTVVGCEVVRGQINRTSMPSGAFVALTPTSLIPLSTNIESYTADSKIILRPAQFSVQIDCYGDQSDQRCAVIAAILRDEYATQSFRDAGYDMQTLYAGDAQQLPLQDAQDQFLERWTFEAQIQINPLITLNQQTANTLHVGLIDVDVEYPPE